MTPSSITVKRPDPETGERFKLTREERRSVFQGTLRVLRRPKKPDQGAGTEIVVSQTRGGRQIVDRETGETIAIPRQPRLWIIIKGWHLRAGSTEWETDITIHDLREQNRVLSNGVGGIPREPGLKTRWGQTVAADGTVRNKRVPKKEEQREHWTPETERGYGGRNGMERDADGELVPATGVDDATLSDFAKRIAEENKFRQLGNHRKAEVLLQERKMAKEYRKGNRSGASAAARRAKRAAKRLDAEVARQDGSTEQISVAV